MLVEPETVRLEHYWHDENKTLCHKYIELPLEIVRKARVIERYTFAYRLEIDGKKYSYRSYRNKSTRKRQHFIDYIIQDMNENLEGFGNQVVEEQMTIFDFLEETMNKQEAIEKIYTASWNDPDYEGLVVNVETVNEIIYQIDEPQKVVLPKFVAEWIEELKKSRSNLAWVWEVYPNEPKIKNWLESNTEKFMRAWLDGYEIEQEEEN